MTEVGINFHGEWLEILLNFEYSLFISMSNRKSMLQNSRCLIHIDHLIFNFWELEFRCIVVKVASLFLFNT